MPTAEFDPINDSATKAVMGSTVDEPETTIVFPAEPPVELVSVVEAVESPVPPPQAAISSKPIAINTERLIRCPPLP
jgi:hypothetical protein